MIGSFIGDANVISTVYTPAVIAALQTEAGLSQSTVLTKDSLKNQPDAAADTAYLFSTWGMPVFTEEEIAAYFPKLKALFYAAGSVQGFARPFLHKGVRVFSAWAANAVPVAEFAAAQILLANTGYFASSRLCQTDYAAARRAFQQFPGNYDCKVGLLGAGMIGSLVIEQLRPHQLEILVFDPFLPDEKAAKMGVRKASLEQIFEECQTISNHLANNAQTVGMLDGQLFSRMRDTATFINTGRGAQVVESDLCAALSKRPFATAVLDVTWPEPPSPGHPFYTLPNVVLTPHIAGSSGQEVHRMGVYMLEEFRHVCRGEAVRYEVSEDMLQTMA